jgi:transcriptional regulator with XRE-family HTH domain
VVAEVARVYPLNRQLPEPLWRQVLGSRLRALRAARGETLAETAERAGISPQYLSEIERGRKEPSSEMIAALAGALDTTLADLTTAVTQDLRHSQGQLRALAGKAARRPRVTARPEDPGVYRPADPGMYRPADPNGYCPSPPAEPLRASSPPAPVTLAPSVPDILAMAA